MIKKVSVLIANYNNGEYFKDCYQSLINQTYSDWEAIIVDDGSTDDSVDTICKIIADDVRFILYRNIQNRGCGFAKHRCVEHASGEICAFLDPDDTLFPTALEKTVAFHADENIAATYSQMILYNEKNNTEVIFASKQIFNDKFFFNYPIQISHFFAFKSAAYLMTDGIDPKLNSAVDQDLYLKILEIGQVKFIQEVLYKYRLHEKGISQFSRKEQAKRSFAQVIYKAMKRRGIDYINNKKIPETMCADDNIFTFLDYQISFFYRLKIKLKLLLKEVL
jgi:glycosyltransferase involved in cell wall biosynthesis